MGTLNGRTYLTADFVGAKGDGYVSLFPQPFVDDLLVEMDARLAAIDAAIAAQNAAITIKINGIAAPGVASLTSLAIGTGAKTFTLTQAASITAGEYKAYSSANAANFMIVRLAADTSSSTTFAVTCDIVGGSGTFADWQIIPLSTPFRYANRSVTGATTVLGTDLGAVLSVSGSGSFTISGTAAATLGSGFYCAIVNGGTGTITFDPNAAELVDGASTMTLLPGETVQLFCDGTAWRTLGSQVITHSLLTKHSITGGTSGHVLRVTGATTFALGALQSGDLPATTQLAEKAGAIDLWRMTRYGR